jgi:hypothetical protein
MRSVESQFLLLSPLLKCFLVVLVEREEEEDEFDSFIAAFMAQFSLLKFIAFT